jgi:hypothetical protein
VCLPKEWQQVMFAQRIQLDVPDQDHAVMRFLKDCIIYSLFHAGTIALREPPERCFEPLRGLYEPFTIWIFTYAFQQLTSQVTYV